MKHIKYILIIILLTGFFVLKAQVNAQGVGYAPAPNSPTPATVATPAKKTPTNTMYQLLAPIPCKPGDSDCVSNGKGGYELQTFDTAQSNSMGAYLNLMIKLFIGICAVLSVVMIVIGGLEYMTSELVHSKEAGKERILSALLGLIIALGAYALLYTINPDLLNSDLCISPQVMQQDGKCVTPTPAVTTPANITPLTIPFGGSTTNNVTPRSSMGN